MPPSSWTWTVLPAVTSAAVAVCRVWYAVDELVGIVTV
jgi:hypothetical protein